MSPRADLCPSHRPSKASPSSSPPGAEPDGLELAGRYASGFIAEVWTIEEARAQRQKVRDAARRAGRNPDEMKYFAGVMPAIAATKRAGLDRRRRAGRSITVPGPCPLLGHADRPEPSADEPLHPPSWRQHARAHGPAFRLVLEGCPRRGGLRDILAHGVIDYHPTTVGPAAVHADHMQEWLEAGAADGFWVSLDIYEDGIDTFVDEVVPLLQNAGSSTETTKARPSEKSRRTRTVRPRHPDRRLG